MRSYSRICSHRASILGSFWGRLAFIGKAVLGRLMVAFSSSGTRLASPKCLNPFIIGRAIANVHATPARRDSLRPTPGETLCPRFGEFNFRRPANFHAFTFYCKHSEIHFVN